MSAEILKRIFKLVANEIICGLLEIQKDGLYPSQIVKRFTDKIGLEYFEKFRKIITSEFSIRSFSDVEYKRGRFYLITRRREATSGEIILENMSIEEYRLEILFQMIIISLDGDFEDVNQKDINGNTLLHLVASLPTENKNAMTFQASFLKKLIDASADCSLKNKQGKTPLQVIAGNYLLHPNKDFVLSHKRGLATECNTNGRLQKLSVLKPLIQKTLMERGRYDNSILYEWLIYHNIYNKMSTNEREIGKWIFDIAHVPTNFANDNACTAFHYAFINDLVTFLCHHKSDPDTTRLNAGSDAPLKRYRSERGSTSEEIMLENRKMSTEEYTLEILYQMIIILLNGDFEDVNQTDINGNTLLHLVASLPTDNEDAMTFQVNVLKKLTGASVDCSMKNNQGITPLHMLAGNFLLDPNNGFVLSHKRGLATECNTNGRLQKLSIFTPLIQEPFMERGRYANSILHEWVIYCSEQITMSTIEREIGKWIFSNANVPTYLANDYGCTALHYAFTNELVKFLCQHKYVHDTSLLNADGDTPFLHIIKHGLLRRLANIANETDFEGILAADMNISFDSDPNNCKPISINGNIIDYLHLETFEVNGFDVAACDSATRNCLDYLVMFVNVLSSHSKEYQQFQEVLKYIVENWIQSLLKSGGAFDNPAAREKALSKLIIAFFEAGSSDQLTSTAEMLFDCIKELFVQGADPNMITFPENNHVLQYCCTKVIRGNVLHLRLVEILRKNGASKNTCSNLGAGQDFI